MCTLFVTNYTHRLIPNSGYLFNLMEYKFIVL